MPKNSSKSQLLEGKSNLLRLSQEIPLSNQEVAEINDGVDAVDRLLKLPADVATPAGPTPRQLNQAR